MKTTELHTDDFRVTFRHVSTAQTFSLVVREARDEQKALDRAFMRARQHRPNALRMFTPSVEKLPNTHKVRVFEDAE